ncbi:MAG: NAD(P)/FAD-dependent oxidoreductase [Enterocloster sp.]
MSDRKDTQEIIVVGGGAAGMIAAISAAREGAKVHLYEKNEKLGKKLFITGKGRCNVTNACDMEELFQGVVTNSKFLYSSFYGFGNQDMMKLLEDGGLPLKTERGNRVFPRSDKSSDVISTLERLMKKEGVQIHLRSRIAGIRTEGGRCRGVWLDERRERFRQAGCVIVATGGLSYPSTGSDGDGYGWARELGHKITELSPALVPFEVKELEEAKSLQGLSLKNVEAAVYAGKKELYREFGEMLFTHFGVSGPLLLSASSYSARSLRRQPLRLVIDLKPALSEEQLDERILRDFSEAINRQFKNSLTHLYPAKLIPVIIGRSGIDPDKKVNEITREERRRLVRVTKGLEFTLTALRDFKEAIITQGGIEVRGVNPSTMESRLAPGLYFAGEILDLDAVTGGFNLQIAWSTGWAAGKNAAESIKNGETTEYETF